MFTQKLFEIFKIEGLEPRMTEIRSFTSLNIAEEQQMRLKILGQQFPQKPVVIKWKPIFN